MVWLFMGIVTGEEYTFRYGYGDRNCSCCKVAGVLHAGCRIWGNLTYPKGTVVSETLDLDQKPERISRKLPSRVGG